MVIIYWKGLTTTALAYCMPSLDAALLGLRPLYQLLPDFDWLNNSLKLSVFSFPQKR
jgi:hypothetical protein